MSDFEKTVREKIMQLDGITLNEWKKISMILDYYFKRKTDDARKEIKLNDSSSLDYSISCFF